MWNDFKRSTVSVRLLDFPMSALPLLSCFLASLFPVPLPISSPTLCCYLFLLLNPILYSKGSISIFAFVLIHCSFTFIPYYFLKKVIQSARCSLLNWRSTLTALKCQAIFTTKCWYLSQLVFLIITTGITHPRHIACLHGLLEPPACLSIFFPVIWGKIW